MTPQNPSSDTTDTIRFRSKVDSWLVWLMVLVLAIPLIWVAVLAWQTGDARPFIFVAISEAITVGLMLLVAMPVWYDVSPDELIVRAGVMRWVVPLPSIRSIRPSFSLISSPAWSMDRLRIDYDNQGHPAFILISPDDRARFMELIEKNRSGS
ncbi:MAG: PH domain-containing protein [Candidatus Methylacidiphilales bacterium]